MPRIFPKSRLSPFEDGWDNAHRSSASKETKSVIDRLSKLIDKGPSLGLADDETDVLREARAFVWWSVGAERKLDLAERARHFIEREDIEKQREGVSEIIFDPVPIAKRREIAIHEILGWRARRSPAEKRYSMLCDYRVLTSPSVEQERYLPVRDVPSVTSWTGPYPLHTPSDAIEYLRESYDIAGPDSTIAELEKAKREQEEWVRSVEDDEVSGELDDSDYELLELKLPHRKR